MEGTPRRGRRPHAAAAALFAVLAAASVVLGVGAQHSITESDQRQLHTELGALEAQVQASLSDLGLPLTKLAGDAAQGDAAFRAVAQLFTPTPFVSVSLWRAGASPREVAAVGDPPVLPYPGALVGVRANGTLAALGRVGPLTEHTLGVAMRLASSPGWIVYGEDLLPAVGPGSPFAGLDFALYVGSISPINLVQATVSTPVRGPSLLGTFPFGTRHVDLVLALEHGAVGALPPAVPWAIGIGGVLVALIAAFVVERLARRREAAEHEATTATVAYGEQREIASVLQHAMKPVALPSFEGLELATAYVPGDGRLEIGGDWFDTIPLGTDRLFVTVGDVSGKGLAAASTMSALRHAIRAYAIQGDAPDDVLAKLSGLVDVRRDDHFATVLCAIIDVAERTVTVATAGHPPVLLRDRSGTRFVEGMVAAPVGVPSLRRPVATTVTVERDASVFLYTDGLVERRGFTVDEGLERLRAAIDSAQGSLESQVASVAAALSDEIPDDVALLGIHWLIDAALVRGAAQGEAR